MTTKVDLENQLAEWRDQLETINEQLAISPDNAEFIELKAIVETGIQEYEVELAKLQSKDRQTVPPPPPPPTESTPAPKWSVENHPAYQGTGRKAPVPSEAATPAPEPQRTYSTNERVQARFKGKFYPARILAVTGSTKDPKFTIKFEGWPDTPTLGLEAIKPLNVPAPSAHSVKRKTDEITGPTYSAAANVNPELASQAKKEPSKVGDGPPRGPRPVKKLKGNKTYEKSANDWKAFNSKMTGKGKLGKKDSMFRTGEGVNARVGFTGSGKEMRADPARQKNRYDKIEQNDDDV